MIFRTASGLPVILRRADGTPILSGGEEPGAGVRRHVASDVWRTGRVTQNRVPAQAVTYMTAHPAHAHGTDIQLTYGGNLPGGVTMPLAAAVEVGGRRVGATFGGSSGAVLNGGTQTVSDPIDIEVNDGDELRVYTYYGERSDGERHLAAPGCWYSNEILPGDQTLTGESRTSGSYDGAAGYFAPMPHSITALVAEDQRAWVLLGDSITESGSPGREVTPLARQTASLTWAHRALADTPVCNTAMWGSAYALGRDAHWATIPNLAPFTDALVAWGYNDLDQAWQVSSRDVAYVQKNAIAAWAWIGAGGPRVWQATVSPSTDSTDGWASIEGQTPRAALPYRLAFNAWLRDGAPIDGAAPAEVGDASAVRAGEAGHPLAGVIDQAARVESEPGSGVFRVDHGPLTADGGHPNAVGHDLMSEALGTIQP